ncbi:type II toxin-antitoxin system RelE/ParE family toxin [Holdemania massiliensis]|uniref:type II toxin-antitoxin system RelE/ParE family toxin n=1 Tax=Holdemania massiliensis TaxID=1468449 RepID=UPI001F057434|nr:type II toxin-antitoxin system RelE/ParE family toxin [Holdemania massiliensis]MCH1939893.1 type II toxin-antitoxin system RelE/ParE family toxin [Holdemania massiliensis]
MAYKIEVTSHADKDLEEILTYIKEVLANVSAASSFLDAVEECYSGLEASPFMFEECRDPHLRVLGYHRAVIRHYVMVYRVDETEKIVYILRFFYGAREYEKLI